MFAIVVVISLTSSLFSFFGSLIGLVVFCRYYEIKHCGKCELKIKNEVQ